MQKKSENGKNIMMMMYDIMSSMILQPPQLSLVASVLNIITHDMHDVFDVLVIIMYIYYFITLFITNYGIASPIVSRT